MVVPWYNHGVGWGNMWSQKLSVAGAGAPLDLSSSIFLFGTCRRVPRLYAAKFVCGRSQSDAALIDFP